MVERDRIVAALEDATYASSIHNSQPWRFQIVGDSVAVLLDGEATPRTVDPSGRWALASIGAVVANLELALTTHTGLATSTELRVGEVPTGDTAGGAAYGGRPLAVVTLSESPASPQVLSEAGRLGGAIRSRFTTRAPLQGGAPESEEWDEISTAVSASEVLEARQAAEPLVRALLRLTAESEVERQDDADYLEEIEQWVSRTNDTGIPLASVGLPDADGRVPTRDFTQTPLGSAAGGEAAFFEDRPALLVLTSSGDTPTEQLLGGYAMQRAMLEATVLGLGIGVLGQALEEPASRALVNDAASDAFGEAVVVHQILRLGHPLGELSHVPTPRRAVAEVILP